MCAVALPLIIVSAAKWENWVRALSSPPASGYKSISERVVCHVNKAATNCQEVSRIMLKHKQSKLTPHVAQIIRMALFHFVHGAQCGLCPTHKVICVWRTNRGLLNKISFGKVSRINNIL